jgi:glycosyltransferase involved in cell wall biosynthesis
MSRIAKRNRVLYFEPGRSPDRPPLAEMWRNAPNFFRLRSDIVRENLIIIATPSVLPVMRRHLPPAVLQITTPAVGRINAYTASRSVKQAMEAYDVQAPILWLHWPYHVHLVGKFNEKLTCYYNYDEFSEFTQNVRVKDLVREFDNRLTSRVDVVFATSRSQWERRQAINPNTYFSPNGVDFKLFNRAQALDCPVPADIAGLQRPVIGFVGWLGYQIDTELLLRVSKAFPECSVVLVGPDDLPDPADRKRLRARTNVFFLGRKEREQLPGYLKAFDVALIPYLLEGHVLSIYPLKLHEYLAAGLPVVTVKLPELEPFSHVVRLADTHDDFVGQIREALQESASEAVEARVAVARQNTWDQRVDAIYRVLEQHLPGVS